MTSKDLIAGRGIARVIVSSVAAMLVAAPARMSAQNIVPSVTHSWLAAERAARTTLGLFGDVTNCTLIRCEQSAALGLNARIAGPFRVTSGVVLQQNASPVLGAHQALVRTDLFYESGSATAWLGHLAGRPNGPQSVRAELMPGFESGFVYRWRSVGLTTLASMGMTRAQIPDASFARDSAAGDTMSARSFTTEVNRWTSAEARLTWRQDRWWVSALLGRISMTQTGASLWGGFQAGADLGRGATLLAGIGASSRLRTAGGTDVARRNVSLGLGFNTSILSSRPEAGQPPTSASEAEFTLSNIATGTYRITIRSVSGRTVEFASDCTGWKPVVMTHEHDMWTVELPILVGPHRANIRVDGGPWSAPPGLMTADDDFAGHVGLFVVE